MTYALTLGAIDDDFLIIDEDPRASYLAWAETVQRYGGYPTAAPHDTTQVRKGEAAAAYPLEVIVVNGQLNPIFKRWPDDWASNGRTGYYRAPESVLAYTSGVKRSLWDMGTWFKRSSAPITAPQTAPGESPPADPKWYDDIQGMLKAGGWIVGGLVVLSALSFVPRRRN